MFSPQEKTELFAVKDAPTHLIGNNKTEKNTNQPLISLVILARLYNITCESDSIRHQLGLGKSDIIGADELVLGAKRIGLKSQRVRTTKDRLPLSPLPALAKMNDGRFVVLAQCDGKRVLYFDGTPGETEHGRPKIEPIEVFANEWSNELILIASRKGLAGEYSKFDFSWFVPSIVKHRRLLSEVLFASLVIQLFALVSPLFFQVVMDKVLVHKGYSTLDVIVVGLVVIGAFESVLSISRSYILNHTTNRMDVELGSRLFRHLIGLPLSYFQERRAGESVARIRELENIRQFLTGSSLTLILDVFFSIIFVAVMFNYSVTLTMIVLASLPLYIFISLSIIPVLRARLNEKFARSAENQSLLVEAVTGIQTVKAGALEPQLAQRWNAQLAAYISASFKTQTLALYGNEGIAVIGKVVNAATLWWGAHLVMDGELTVGMFIAFNMFAGRVAQPIMRMSQMWTDFQQVGLSMARLGDVLNTRTELSSRSNTQLPRVYGRVTLNNITFRYRPDSHPVLRNINVDVSPGEIIGIVGRSGSGKSSLTKLIQRLYVPESGRILLDGHDISLMDTSFLRRTIGVVLQENSLFHGTVRENIAISDPSAPFEEILSAAKLAGAHDFIIELPEGYDTLVGEQGASLSGGQRQRISIARTLFSKPRILIFDEATSALDYESEAIIQKNMRDICKGRTVFIIAHRLSAVRKADRIIAMDKGEILETGTHTQLLSLPKGLYAMLWNMQLGISEGAAA